MGGVGLLSKKKSSPSQALPLSRNFPKLPCRNGRKLGETLFMGGCDEIAMYMTFSLAQTKEGMLCSHALPWEVYSFSTGTCPAA